MGIPSKVLNYESLLNFVILPPNVKCRSNDLGAFLESLSGLHDGRKRRKLFFLRLLSFAMTSFSRYLIFPSFIMSRETMSNPPHEEELSFGSNLGPIYSLQTFSAKSFVWDNSSLLLYFLIYSCHLKVLLPRVLKRRR